MQSPRPKIWGNRTCPPREKVTQIPKIWGLPWPSANRWPSAGRQWQWLGREDSGQKARAPRDLEPQIWRERRDDARRVDCRKTGLGKRKARAPQIFRGSFSQIFRARDFEAGRDGHKGSLRDQVEHLVGQGYVEKDALRLVITKEARLPIEQAMREAGLSNREIGEKLGVSKSTVQSDLSDQNWSLPPPKTGQNWSGAEQQMDLEDLTGPPPIIEKPKRRRVYAQGWSRCASSLIT
jgi:hypothetical protein